MDNNELQHYGVKGMKWGIRKDRPASGGLSSFKRKTKKKQKAFSIVVNPKKATPAKPKTKTQEEKPQNQNQRRPNNDRPRPNHNRPNRSSDQNYQSRQNGSPQQRDYGSVPFERKKESYALKKFEEVATKVAVSTLSTVAVKVVTPAAEHYGNQILGHIISKQSKTSLAKVAVGAASYVKKVRHADVE